MGAYNTVEQVVPCTVCGRSLLVAVQFKYGLTFQFHYKIGDMIEFQNPEKSTPESSVVADGAATCICPSCSSRQELDFYVFVQNGVIVGVEIADGRFSFVNPAQSFNILSP